MRLLSKTNANVIENPDYTKYVLLDSDVLASAGTRVQIVTIAPGHTVADHYHRHTREFYYVMEGTCRLVVNGTETILNVGDMLLMEPEDRHRLTNPGPDLFAVLVFKTNGNDDTHWS